MYLLKMYLEQNRIHSKKMFNSEKKPLMFEKKWIAKLSIQIAINEYNSMGKVHIIVKIVEAGKLNITNHGLSLKRM